MRRFLLSICIVCCVALPVAAQQDSDPLEGFNRAIFDFNDTIDVHLLEPIAKGYDKVTPQFVDTGVTNFFQNLRYPRYLVSDVVQLKFGQALSHTGRFIINSTVGLLGLIDVAQHVGLESHQEDFGTALGYWGVEPGAYIVLPFLGPSNVRDTVGFVVDVVLDPVFFVEYIKGADLDWRIPLGATSLKIVDTRAGLLEAVKTAKESSLDYYGFTKAAYHQYRQGLIYDGFAPDEEGDDADLEFSEEESALDGQKEIQ